MSEISNSYLPLIPANEAERMETLHSYSILDTAADRHLDDIIHLASEICGTPIALISLVDENRQWFKARKGIDITSPPSKKPSYSPWKGEKNLTVR